MLIRRHSTKNVSARFPREMPACAKRAQFYFLPTKDQDIWANGADPSASVAKHVCRAQHAVPLRLKIQMQTQQKGARLNKAAATKPMAYTKPKRD